MFWLGSRARRHGISAVQVFERPELASALPEAAVESVRAFRNTLSTFAADPGHYPSGTVIPESAP